MKKIVSSLAILSVAACLSAQTAMPNFSKLGYKKPVMYSSKIGGFEEFHDQADVVEIGTVLFNTKTNQVVGFASEDKVETEVSSATSAMSIDPHCERYPWITPYAYALNNPVRYIDPDGMDVYRYDDKSGDMILSKKTNDKFDQIGKFKTVKNKETGEKSYELKTNKDGTAKTRIDNIEKGILSDGINFMKKDKVIAVGGERQASVGGVENFLLDFSNMIDKELGGYYLSDKNSNDISLIYVGNFKNNSAQEAKGGFNLYGIRPDLVGNIDVKVDFHTHLSRFGDSDRLNPSSLGGNGGDRGHKERQLKINPLLKFLIITNPKPFYY